MLSRKLILAFVAVGLAAAAVSLSVHASTDTEVVVSSKPTTMASYDRTTPTAAPVFHPYWEHGRARANVMPRVTRSAAPAVAPAPQSVQVPALPETEPATPPGVLGTREQFERHATEDAVARQATRPQTEPEEPGSRPAPQHARLTRPTKSLAATVSPQPLVPGAEQVRAHLLGHGTR